MLIDPLLRELGWDVSNPEAVQLEYKVGDQRADYALMSGDQPVDDDQPVAVIEAKPLGSSLKDRVIGQALAYANLDVIITRLLLTVIDGRCMRSSNGLRWKNDC